MEHGVPFGRVEHGSGPAALHDFLRRQSQRRESSPAPYGLAGPGTLLLQPRDVPAVPEQRLCLGRDVPRLKPLPQARDNGVSGA